MKHRVLILLVLFAPFWGCAETYITSIKAPNHSNNSKLLIRANFEDVGLKQSYENAICSSLLARYHVVAIKSIDVFPPLREYSDSEISAEIARLGCDGILMVNVNGITTGSSTSYNSLTGSLDTHQTVDATHNEVKLFDAKTGEVVYRASVYTSLGELSTVDYGLTSAADKITDDLVENGFIKVASSKPHTRHKSPNPDEG